MGKSTGQIIGALAAPFTGGVSYLVGKQQDDRVNAKKKAADNQYLQEQQLLGERNSIEQRARAEADAKLSDSLKKKGRMSSVATSPLGVVDAAPIARASLSGRSLLG